MYKFFLLITLTSCSLFTNAQIKKGTLLVGGDLSFSTTANETDPIITDDSQSQMVNLSVGTAIKRNTVVGFVAGYSHHKSENEQMNAESEFNGFNAGVFYRKYKNLTRNFYFFGQGTLGGTFGKNSYEGNLTETETKSTSVNLSIIPGISYQVVKRLQVELSLPNFLSIGYGTSKSETDNIRTGKSENFNFNTGLNGGILQNIGIGFRLTL